MEIRAAYKQAFKEELEVLVAQGKIQVLGTLEDVAESLTNGVGNALVKGAELSENPVDDILVAPMVAFFKPLALSQVDKIDGKVKGN